MIKQTFISIWCFEMCLNMTIRQEWLFDSWSYIQIGCARFTLCSECVCVCVWERDREREGEREGEREEEREGEV